MDFAAIGDYVKKNLSSKRFEHSVGVSETAVRLAQKYGCDVQKAALSGLLHDIGRELDRETQLNYIKSENIEADAVMLKIKELLHGPAAVHIAKVDLGITDEEILSAIQYHTTGKAEMTLLEKIVFLADFIEPGRKFDGVEKIRKAADKNMDKALLLALDASIHYVIEKKALIHPYTIDARNALLLKMKKD